MVEQSTVNRLVVGSSPTRGACTNDFVFDRIRCDWTYLEYMFDPGADTVPPGAATTANRGCFSCRSLVDVFGV